MSGRCIYVVVALVMCIVARPSFSCSCPESTEQERFDAAQYVARVKVTAAELRDIRELRHLPEYEDWKDEVPEYVRVSFKAVEVFKGAAPKYLREFPFGPGNCTLGLLPGMEYVVFLDEESHGFVFLCSGSFGFFNEDGSKVAQVLNQLREWAQAGK